MAIEEFIDENAQWPLWRPVLGTLAGAIAIAAWTIINSPAQDHAGGLSAPALGGALARALITYGVLYFAAYSRRGTAWRLGAFVLFVAVAIGTSAIVVGPPPPGLAPPIGR